MREQQIDDAALLEPARTLGDATSEARLHNNLGCCAVQLNDFANADVYFSEAVRRFRELGMALEAVRSEMHAGRMLLAKDEGAAALPRLQRARAHFLRHGLVEEAGLCGLEIASILIARNEAREARRQRKDGGDCAALTRPPGRSMVLRR